MDAIVKMFRQFLSLPQAMMTAMVGPAKPAPRSLPHQPPTPGSPGPTEPSPSGQEGDVEQKTGTQFLVRFTVFHSIIDANRLQDAVTETHDQLNHIIASGKVLASGAYAGQRGGFVLIEVGSGAELLGLLAPGLSDNCTIEIDPVLPFDQQGEALATFGFQVPH